MAHFGAGVRHARHTPARIVPTDAHSRQRPRHEAWKPVQAIINVTAVQQRPPVTIRNLDEPLKARLRIQAAVHGRSMEDEARDILRVALNRESVKPANLAAAIQRRFAPLGGVELPEVLREPMREPPDFTP
jgi:antitoxin FitA